MQRIDDVDGKRKWVCVFCGRKFNSWHATKALFHMAKAPGGDIQVCLSPVPPWLQSACRDKIKSDGKKKASKKRVREQQNSAANERIDEVGAHIQEARRIGMGT